MTRSLVVLAVLAVACGGKPAPQTAENASLAISELKFYDNDKLGMQLHVDGKIDIRYTRIQNGTVIEGWEQLGTLAPDGTLTSNDQKFRIRPDGTVKKPDGSTETMFRFDGDTLVLGDKRVTIDPQGVLLVNGQPTPNGTMRVEGANDPRTRHTALVLVALLFGRGDQPQ